MNNTSYVALSGQTAVWRQLDVVANNIANMNTPAYRRQAPVFTSFLASTPNNNALGQQQLAYAQDYGIETDITAGPINVTHNPMDMALDGKGFFVVKTPDGDRYTRNGRFMLDNKGRVVTSEGYAVMSATNQPLVVAPNEKEFYVAEDGTISTENTKLGKFRVVTFDNEQTMRRSAGSLWEPPADQTAKPATKQKVMQGALENSNVNSVAEMTRMIEVQRSYSNTQSLLDAENDRVKQVIDVLSRLS